MPFAGARLRVASSDRLDLVHAVVPG